jgi:hypothetical protein
VLQVISAMTTWKFIKAFTDGEPFEFLPGHNIWDYDWKHVYRDPPAPRTGNAFKDMTAAYEKALVIDPIYGTEHEFTVWEVAVNGRVIRFAAQEFSNNIWGFYLPVEGSA